jgi:hypothetical protein
MCGGVKANEIQSTLYAFSTNIHFVPFTVTRKIIENMIQKCKKKKGNTEKAWNG